MKNQNSKDLVSENKSSQLNVQDFTTGLWGADQPDFNISETDNEIDITANIPDFDEKDIKITYQNGNLFIRGEKRGENQSNFDNFYYQESWSGSFSRSIPINLDIDIDKASSQFKNGQLNIHIPKK